MPSSSPANCANRRLGNGSEARNSTASSRASCGSLPEAADPEGCRDRFHSRLGGCPRRVDATSDRAGSRGVKRCPACPRSLRQPLVLVRIVRRSHSLRLETAPRVCARTTCWQGVSGARGGDTRYRRKPPRQHGPNRLFLPRNSAVSLRIPTGPGKQNRATGTQGGNPSQARRQQRIFGTLKTTLAEPLAMPIAQQYSAERTEGC